MTSALWGRLAQHNRLFKTENEIENENLDVGLTYSKNHDWYIRDTKYKKDGTEICELVNCRKQYYFSIARIKPFLLAKSRELTGKVAIKYIDDVIRIHTDNITFNKEHDNVIFHQKTFKLTKELKTTGEIEWRNCACYKNYTNEKYTTKTFTMKLLKMKQNLRMTNKLFLSSYTLVY